MVTEVWLAILISNWKKARCFYLRYLALVSQLVDVVEAPTERLCINSELIKITGNCQQSVAMVITCSCWHTESQEAWMKQIC